MPSFQGQTDQVLRIQVQSVLASVSWLSDRVAAGGWAVAEIRTAYVGDGAPIQLKILGEDGATIASVTGTVQSNLHRSQINIPADCQAKTLVLEVELPKHSLKGKSGLLAVVPTPNFTELKWTDKEGQVLSAIETDQVVACEAKVAHLNEGDPVLVTVFQKREHGRTLLLSADAPVKQGRVKLPWNHGDTPGVEKIAIQKDLNCEGGHYHAPEYLFTVSALGVSVESEAIAHQTWIEYDFGPNPDAGRTRTALFELADGVQQEESVPEDGLLRLTQVLPGHVIFKGFKHG